MSKEHSLEFSGHIYTQGNMQKIINYFVKWLPYEELWLSLVFRMVKNLPAIRETRFDPWVGKIPWRRERQPTPVFFPGEFNGQRSLVGYSLWDCKELDMTE